MTKESRRIRWAGWGFLAFTLGMAAAFAAGVNEELHNRRFASEGVTVEAAVQRAWMVRVTPHIEYSFTDSSGNTVVRKTMMYSGPDWEHAKANRTVQVIYLRSAPAWNHLVRGENAGAEFGGKFLFLTGGGILMCGFFAIVALNGYDLKSENGVTTLLRNGRVLREWKR